MEAVISNAVNQTMEPTVQTSATETPLIRGNGTIVGCFQEVRCEEVSRSWKESRALNMNPLVWCRCYQGDDEITIAPGVGGFNSIIYLCNYPHITLGYVCTVVFVHSKNCICPP